MRVILFLLCMLLNVVNSFSQISVEEPQFIGSTYEVKLKKDKCIDGKCKEGYSGTLRFKDYGKLKDYTGTFGEEDTFLKGTLNFLNGDSYTGSFITKKFSSLVVYYDTGTFKKANSYSYTARFIDNKLNSNIQISFTDGATYSGTVKDGFLDGYGKLIYPGGLMYEGTYVKGKREGHGIFKNLKAPEYIVNADFTDDYPNGKGYKVSAGTTDTIAGQFSNGRANGIMVKTSTSGKKIFQYFRYDSLIYDNLVKLEEGYCINGNCKTGKGKILFDDERLYEGNVKNGKAEGIGTITYSASTYTGAVLNNLRNGKGKTLYNNGNYYEGDFKNDKWSGEGSCYWAENNYYKGSVDDNKFNGHGIRHYATGDVYDGNWVNDTLNGIGTFTWTSGNKYVGQWKNGNENGNGIFYWANGNKYEGYFEDDALKGHGLFTYASGDKYVSDNWNKFSFTSGTWTKKDGSTVSGLLKDDKFMDAAAQQADAFAAKNPGANGVIPINKRKADMVAGKLHDGAYVTHFEKNVDLGKGYYSVVIPNFHMIASFATGFKQYYLVPGEGGKKYPLPFGIHITYEFINSKGELVSRQDVNGHNLEGVFDAPVDGDYTIQAKYDFSGCISCTEVGGTRIKFSLISRDYIY